MDTSEARKTHVEMPRGKRPATWSASDQMILDQKVKQAQQALRANKKVISEPILEG